MSDDPSSTNQDYQKQASQVWFYGITLGVFAGITTWVSRTHAHIGLALLFASIQIFLQVFFMMHLKNERGIIFKFLVFTIFFVMALFVLTHLHESDPLHSKAIPVN